MVSRLGSVPESPGGGTPGEGTSFPLEGACPEVEAKFLIEDASQVGDLVDSLDSYYVRSASVVDVVDDYWDTPGWHLFRAGWAYRWRDCSGDKSMMLKSFRLGKGIVQRRREVERRVLTFPQDGSHPLVAELVADRSGGLRSGDLRRLFRVQTHRRLFDIRLPCDALVEVGIDRTIITAVCPVKKPAPGRMAFVEVEMELKEGEEESLRQLAAETQQRFRSSGGPAQQIRTGIAGRGLVASAGFPRGVAGEDPVRGDVAGTGARPGRSGHPPRLRPPARAVRGDDRPGA